MLDRMSGDVIWDALRGSSLDKLEVLAEQALEEHRRGESLSLDTDTL
jgi:hypothetical protein